MSYALSPDEAKKNCKDKGYEVGTEKFTDCALNLVLGNKDNAGKKEEKKGLAFIEFNTKDCSHLKGKKLHKYLACKGGSSKYDDEAPLEAKKEKTKETFNEKYNSFADFFKKKN